MLSSDDTGILTKITWARLWNACLIHLSFYLSRFFKQNIQWGMPYAFSVEPTTSCNLRCPECPSGLRSFSRNTGSIPLENFKKIIDQYAHKAFFLNLYFQGEPFLNPAFNGLVQYAHQKRIHTSTSTNAHYLTESMSMEVVKSGLDRLIISIDGTTQDTYEQYRVGGSLQKVKAGIENILRAKQKMKSKTPYVVLQFLVVKPNEHQIQEVQAFGRESGVDEVKLKTAQIYDYQNGNHLIPTLEKYARYIKQPNGQYRLKHQLKDECWKMWHSNVVTWDGDVVPCCFDKDAKYVMGNILLEPLGVVWNSPKYQAFRKQIWAGREQIDICQNCTQGAKVFSD